MQAVLSPPGFGDVLSLLGYILTHPHLFIGSTTVMTTGLVVGVGLTAAFAAVGAPATPGVARGADRLLDWLAPKLTLVLAWFGIGSMLLATEILIRFHDVFPDGTEMQFRSGLGHLIVAVAGIGLLRSRLAGRTRRQWVEAHFWALTYLSLHVVLLTPPWFDFMFQGELIRLVANVLLATALAFNVYLWRRLPPEAPPGHAAA
ncbi:MAG: hypothetical protein ACRDGT_12310 [Candidatus Limnocylindria bacterium]